MVSIALLGGTGDIGEGLALRWARDSDHEVLVGSRDPEKATAAVEQYRDRLSDQGIDATIDGDGNAAVADQATIVVVSVPPEYAADTVEEVADGLDDGDVLVCPAVRMARDGDGFHYERPDAGSVAEEVAAAAPDGVPVVGAFQNLAAGALSDLDADLHADVVLTGDDADAKARVRDLAEDIAGLRALDGGPLGTSAVVESVTPLLINLAMNNEGMHDLTVRFE